MQAYEYSPGFEQAVRDGTVARVLPVYADCEEMEGRLRAFVPMPLFKLTLDRSGHDGGDEDRAR